MQRVSTLQPIELDTPNIPGMYQRFLLFSKNKRFNEPKFRNELFKSFGDSGESIFAEFFYNLLKRYFGNYRIAYDYEQFCEVI